MRLTGRSCLHSSWRMPCAYFCTPRAWALGAHGGAWRAQTGAWPRAQLVRVLLPFAAAEALPHGTRCRGTRLARFSAAHTAARPEATGGPAHCGAGPPPPITAACPRARSSNAQQARRAAPIVAPVPAALPGATPGASTASRAPAPSAFRRLAPRAACPDARLSATMHVSASE